jgi:hypothetical protein
VEEGGETKVQYRKRSSDDEDVKDDPWITESFRYKKQKSIKTKRAPAKRTVIPIDDDDEKEGKGELSASTHRAAAVNGVRPRAKMQQKAAEAKGKGKGKGRAEEKKTKKMNTRTQSQAEAEEGGGEPIKRARTRSTPEHMPVPPLPAWRLEKRGDRLANRKERIETMTIKVEGQ